MERPKYSLKNLPRRHSVQHKLHMKWLGISVRPPTWEATDTPLEPQQDVLSQIKKPAGSHKSQILYIYPNPCP